MSVIGKHAPRFFYAGGPQGRGMQPSIVVGLVEDDPVQAEIISAMLAAGGLQFRCYGSAQEFRRRQGAESVDVLLLDWNLPGVKGIDLLKSIKEQYAEMLPTILLTANDDERDVVYGLQCGAEDYIVKPPRAAEMVARVIAAYRRVHPHKPDELIDTAPFIFDLRERELWLHGVKVNVTEREFDLLAYLFRRHGRIVSREMLLTEVWKLGKDSNTRSIDTYVSRLRRSLGLNGENGWTLSGVYQAGYRLVRA